MWIEIFREKHPTVRPAGHSPHGECGLKSGADLRKHVPVQSLPAWGVWIEILCRGYDGRCWLRSLPAWGVWIEITLMTSYRILLFSHSPHGECGY